MNKPVKYTCPKCGQGSCKIFPVRTSGTLASSFFNIQNKKFSAVVCNSCQFTEFYNMQVTKTREYFGLEERKGLG